MFNNLSIGYLPPKKLLGSTRCQFLPGLGWKLFCCCRTPRPLHLRRQGDEETEALPFQYNKSAAARVRSPASRSPIGEELFHFLREGQGQDLGRGEDAANGLPAQVLKRGERLRGGPKLNVAISCPAGGGKGDADTDRVHSLSMQPCS